MNIDTMRLLVSKGLSAEDILEIAEAMSDKSLARVITDLRGVDCPSAAIALVVQELAEREIATRFPRLRKEAERTARYRSRRSITDSEWYALRNAVISRDGYACSYCGIHTDAPHCDHIVPLARGGTNDLDNLTVACPQCNASKRDSLLSEWAPPEGGWA